MKLKDIKKGQLYVCYFPSKHIISIVRANGKVNVKTQSFSGTYVQNTDNKYKEGMSINCNVKMFQPYDPSPIINTAKKIVENAVAVVKYLKQQLEEAEGVAQKAISEHEILAKKFKTK